MKKILLSLVIIGAAAAIVIGATTAFFSDTETSTGNTFTAGAIDLKVDSTQHYNNAVCVNSLWVVANPTPNQYPVAGSACDGTWTETDLGASYKFFNFGDVKPGDSGEDTVSLHVINNDAWLRLVIRDVTDLDNSCTEPEEGSSDVCTVAAPEGTMAGAGELRENLKFSVFADGNCNNILDQQDLPLITAGTIDAAGETWQLPNPIPGGQTVCLGITWDLPLTVGNEVQTDSMSATMEFQVEQARNNPNPFASTPTAPTVGALLSAYVAPTTCNVTVDDNGGNAALDTIQEGIDAATAGQTVCVKAGTYTQDVVVNKSLTLVGDGSALTSLTGVGTGWSGAVSVASGVDNVTIEGFEINGAGVAAVYLIGNNDNVDVLYNRIVTATGKNALLTGGQQTNSTLSNNVFEGNATGSQLVYVNGSASLGGANASDNVDFLNNTFGGSGNLALGQEASNSDVKLNKFSTVTSYTDVEAWATGILVNQNNFNESGLMVQNSVAGTLDAENNWWGDLNPADNVGGTVDFTPFEASAFPQN